MSRGLVLTLKALSWRYYVIVMVFSVFGVVIEWLFINNILGFIESDWSTPTNQVELASSTINPVVLERSEPLKLTIPALKLEAQFEAPLGLNPDQTVAVPQSYDKVGWYKHGVTPGEVGPAVILGHVDSVSGPAIFYPLDQLSVSDQIEVMRTDGITALFEVTAVKRYPQSEFPTNLVYGQTDTPTLRLVTCTGIFDKDKQRYSHNLIVYASFVSNSGPH